MQCGDGTTEKTQLILFQHVCFNRVRNEWTRDVEEAVLTQHGTTNSAVLQDMNSGGCRGVKIYIALSHSASSSVSFLNLRLKMKY